MMSNNRILTLVIIAHLSIDQAGGKYCYDRRMFKKVVEIIQQVHCPKNKADFRENKRGSPLEGTFSSNPWK
jgi:hypothetical protein